MPSWNEGKAKRGSEVSEDEIDVYEKWLRNKLGYDMEEEFSPSNYMLDKNDLFIPFGKYKRKRIDVIAWNDPSYLKWLWKNCKEKLPTGVRDFIKENREHLEEDIKEQEREEEWL